MNPNTTQLLNATQTAVLNQVRRAALYQVPLRNQLHRQNIEHATEAQIIQQCPEPSAYRTLSNATALNSPRAWELAEHAYQLLAEPTTFKRWARNLVQATNPKQPSFLIRPPADDAPGTIPS